MNEVGERLKEARKAMGYTLDDLQQKTKIQKRYLIAIEEGNYEVMPGKFYIRAFIKQYADTVGLDGDKLLNEYSEAIPQPQEETSTESIKLDQTRSSSRNHNKTLETFREYLPTILISLLVIAIGVSISLAINRLPSQETAKETAKETTSSAEDVKVSSAADGSSSEEESGEQIVEKTSSNKTETLYTVKKPLAESTIVLVADGAPSWSSVEADGETIKKGLIEDGERIEAVIPEKTESVKVVVGYAPATEVQLNGEKIDYTSEATAKGRHEIDFKFEEK